VLEKNGSSGRTRTYNPSVNRGVFYAGVLKESKTYAEQNVVVGARSVRNGLRNGPLF